MKKVIVALAAVAMAGVASADIYANLSVGFGIGGNGSAGGIVDAVDGTELVLQVLAGGGDGLGGAVYDGTSFVGQGNDLVLGSWSAFVTGGGADFSDWASTLRGDITEQDTADTWVRVSGIASGDWVYQTAISFQSLDSTDSLQLPEAVFVDNGGLGDSADGSVTVSVIPEPATLGLMGIAGLGMFLARKKARR